MVLGLLAKAGEPQHFPLAGGVIAAYSIHDPASDCVTNGPEAVFERDVDNEHIIKIRSRFRLGSSVTVKPAVLNNVTVVVAAPGIHVGITRNSRTTLPLYYLFLFRLTPF
jgi:hypothetical protein